MPGRPAARVLRLRSLARPARCPSRLPRRLPVGLNLRRVDLGAWGGRDCFLPFLNLKLSFPSQTPSLWTDLLVLHRCPQYSRQQNERAGFSEGSPRVCSAFSTSTVVCGYASFCLQEPGVSCRRQGATVASRAAEAHLPVCGRDAPLVPAGLAVPLSLLLIKHENRFSAV